MRIPCVLALQVALSDVDTQLLLESALKGLRELKGPTAADLATANAPRSWQQQRQLPLQVGCVSCSVPTLNTRRR